MFAFMRRKKKSFWNEFTVLGAFAAVVVAGFMYAIIVATFQYARPEVAAIVQKAPTVEEYRQEAKDVFSPFLSQAEGMEKGDIDEAGALFRELAVKTQERLLRLRVPREERDSHLSFVLLLDQWKRALDGSTPDRAVVVERTRQVISANLWLR